MGNGVQRGGRDFWEPGTFDVMCAYCGRKRKANELRRDNEFARGMWCCPEHADDRHPQDYARGVKEDMSTPFVQPPIIYFRTLNTTFPISIWPDPIVLLQGPVELITESGLVLMTENGSILITENNTYVGEVGVLLPNSVSSTNNPFGVYVTEVEWSWAEGGTGIVIDSPAELYTFLTATAVGSGVLQVQVTNSLGEVGTATAEVSI